MQGLDALEERFNGGGYLVVAASGGTPDDLRRFADEIAPRLTELATIRYVDFKRPLEWLADRALYFVDLEDLETAYSRVKARYDEERRRRNPMYFELEDEEPLPALAFDDLEAKYTARMKSSWMVGGSGPSEAYYIDPNTPLLMLLCKPARRAIDLEYTHRVVAEVQALVDSIDTAQYGGITIELAGSYKKKVDQHAQIKGDLQIATALALVLMLGYLALHFRRASAVFLVMTPLLVGMAWTIGAAATVFGNLNLLTGFIGAILLGLGIDHGIHLLGRLSAEQHGDFDPQAAIERTFGQTGHAVLVAALTTAAAFAGVGISDFRAFREFGVVAGVGSMLVVIAYSTVLPALLGFRPRQRAAAEIPGRASNFARALPTRARAILLVSVPIVVAITAVAPRVGFDLDFQALEDGKLRSYVLDRKTDRLLGYTQSPSIVLTETADQERRTIEAFREAKGAGEAKAVDFVAGVSDMVPGQQADKHEVLTKLARIVRKVKPSWLDDDEQRDALKRLRPMVEAEPFTRAQLPIEVRRQFQGPEATPDEGFVLVFPAHDMSDGALVLQFAREVREVGAKVEGVAPAAGEAMVLADLLQLILDEAPVVLGFTSGVVMLTLWLLLGRLRTALACLVPAFATVLVLLGLLVLTPLELNFLNIVMLPVLVGVGVDAGVHLVLRIDEADDFVEVFGETARSIAGAMLTTSLGFGTLVLADHPGLRSVGELAALGLAVNLLMALVVFGGWLAWRERGSLLPETLAEETT